MSEGVATARAVVDLARNAGVETPICEGVAALVAGEKTVDDIVAGLLARPFKTEA